MVLLNASVLLGVWKQVEARWERHLAAVSTRLRARLEHSQASSWPKPAIRQPSTADPSSPAKSD